MPRSTIFTLDLILQVAQHLLPLEGYVFLRAFPWLARHLTFEQVKCKDTFGNTLLHVLLMNGEMDLLRSVLLQNEVPQESGSTPVLKKGMPFNSQNMLGRTLLHMAVEEQHEELVRLLIDDPKVNVDPRDIQGCSPLRRAVLNRNERIVQIILGRRGHLDLDTQPRGGEVDLEFRPILRLLVAMGLEDAVRSLLQRQNWSEDLDPPDEDGRTVLLYAAGEGNESVVEMLLSREGASYSSESIGLALSAPAAAGNMSMVRLFLSQNGTSVNIRGQAGMTPLYKAAENGRTELAKYLLSFENIQPDLPTDLGWTPLIAAACFGHLPVVQMLLAHTDVEVNTMTDQGSSALMLAAEMGRDAVVDALLGAEGIDINAVDGNTDTALFVAASARKEGVVRLLLEKGADPNKRNAEGRTPLREVLRVAKGQSHGGIAKLLLLHSYFWPEFVRLFGEDNVNDSIRHGFVIELIQMYLALRGDML